MWRTVLKVTFLLIFIGSKVGGRQELEPHSEGPKSFIFMQFSAKNLENNSNFGSWPTPLGKILDPPLIFLQIIVREIYLVFFSDSVV